MSKYNDFEKFEKRLNALDEDIRTQALEYAAEIFAEQNLSREEALEEGISRAEIKKRDL